VRHVKITQAGFEGYTGHIGIIDFADGVSVEPLPAIIVNRISAALEIAFVNEDGSTEQAGVAYQLVGGATLPAEVVEPLKTATQEQLDADRKARDGASQEVALTDYTEASLQAIADKEGIKGLRPIGEDLDVRERSIPGLIDLILKKQAEIAEKHRTTPAMVSEHSQNDGADVLKLLANSQAADVQVVNQGA
jgi:hypothetical protein